MSWWGAVAMFAGAIAVVGVALVMFTLIERSKRGPQRDDTGSIGCGVILFVIGLTIVGGVML